ncbi:MAG: tetratricopeptide repeat protein, partial [Deltaproteobacteria bacterium]|nr:tetratricopeptide repeat protein [Deltaproteobacteria bacterium]
YLAGFYFFLRYRQTKKITFILAAFLSYLLSLGSKEMAVTLPAVFLCYDLVENFAGRAGRINLGYLKELALTLKKVILQSKYLYFTTFVGALAYIYYKIFIKSPSFQNYYYGDSMLTTFLTVGKILVHYIRLLVYPIRLNADYYYDAFPLSTSFLEPATLYSFMVLGIIGYAVIRLLAHHKMLAFGIVWFFVTLLPVCQIFPHHELLAEHYLYLPSFGFCLISAVLINGVVEEKKYRYLTYAAFAAVFFLFSIRIADRNGDWKDGLTLWEKTVKTAPRCARARNNLGLAYVEEKRLDEAIAEYKRALTIKPNFAQAHDNLGIAYAKKGRFKDAISEYRKAIAIRPDNAEVYSNLGNVYNKQGR